jgi:hypothetical protein
LLLAGCKVDTTVTVTMHDDGSGVVKVTAVLDADAVKTAEAGGAKLEDRVRVADLTKSGWTVAPWARAKDGSATLVLTKPFDDPAQATAILQQISGATGPLQGMKVTRDEGTFSTKYSVTGTIDLEKLGTGISGDQQLTQSLTAQGVDVGALDQTLLSGVRNALSVSVVAELPGTTTTVRGQSGKVTPVDATSSVRDGKKVALVVLAVVLLLAAAFVLLRPSRRRGGGPGRVRPQPINPPGPTYPSLDPVLDPPDAPAPGSGVQRSRPGAPPRS